MGSSLAFSQEMIPLQNPILYIQLSQITPGLLADSLKTESEMGFLCKCFIERMFSKENCKKIRKQDRAEQKSKQSCDFDEIYH